MLFMYVLYLIFPIIFSVSISGKDASIFIHILYTILGLIIQVFVLKLILTFASTRVGLGKPELESWLLPFRIY